MERIILEKHMFVSVVPDDLQFDQILSNIFRFCKIFFNVVQYCTILSNGTQYCLILIKWLFDFLFFLVVIVFEVFLIYFQKVVNHCIILFDNDQYCQVALLFAILTVVCILSACGCKTNLVDVTSFCTTLLGLHTLTPILAYLIMTNVGCSII